MSLNNMPEALLALKAGYYSVSQAARYFNIPETTLRQYVSNQNIAVKPVSGYSIFIHFVCDLYCYLIRRNVVT